MIQIIEFIRFHFNRIILIFIFFHTIGFIYWLATPNVYESSMSGYSTILSDKKIKLILTEIKDLIARKQYKPLINILGTDQDVLSKIGDLKISTDFEETKSKQMAENYFTIRVKTTDLKALKAFQSSLEQYLLNNPHVRLFIDANRNSMEARLNDLEKEKLFLDSAKKVLLDKVNAPPKGSAILDVDLGSLSKASQDLSERCNELRLNIYLNRGLFITKSFNEIPLKAWPKLSIIFICAFFLSITFSTALFFLSEAKSKG